MLAIATTEDEWLNALADVPSWTPPLTPTVILAPHPDDETLACGGLILYLRQRDVPVRVIAVTDGEAAYADSTGLASLRTSEQEAALAELGVSTDNIVRLHLKDSGLHQQEQILTQSLLEIVDSSDHLVAPWQHDWHPDHEACGRAAAGVASRKKATLTSWFFWSWHNRSPQTLASLSLRSLKLDPAMLAVKQRAISKHHSQLMHASGEPILPPALLTPATRPFEVFESA